MKRFWIWFHQIPIFFPLENYTVNHRPISKWGTLIGGCLLWILKLTMEKFAWIQKSCPLEKGEALIGVGLLILYPHQWWNFLWKRGCETTRGPIRSLQAFWNSKTWNLRCGHPVTSNGESSKAEWWFLKFAFLFRNSCVVFFHFFRHKGLMGTWITFQWFDHTGIPITLGIHSVGESGFLECLWDLFLVYPSHRSGSLDRQTSTW